MVGLHARGEEPCGAARLGGERPRGALVSGEGERGQGGGGRGEAARGRGEAA